MAKQMSKKQVLRGRSGGLVVRRSIALMEEAESTPSTRLRGESSTRAASQVRGRGIQPEVESGDD